MTSITEVQPLHAYAMVRSSALAIGMAIGNHTFRATGITAYLKPAARLRTRRRLGVASHHCPLQLRCRFTQKSRVSGMSDNYVARGLPITVRFLVELAETKAKAMREPIAMVARAVGVLFTLLILCFAAIATVWQTPYFLTVVWGIAGFWLIISVVPFLVLRAQKPVKSFKTLQSEIRDDMAAIKKALK